MSDLPEGWAEAALSTVCNKITDGTHHSPVNLPAGDFKYVTAKNIRPWGLDLGNISYVDAETHREIYARCPVEKGDVLYIKDGATTGLAVVNPLDEPFSMLSSVALLKPRFEAIESSYLKYWLNSPTTLATMLDQMTGTAIRRLTLKTISAQTIRLPPLLEQRRIVAKVDGLTARTARARKDLNRIPTLIARYKQRLLALAFSGELTAGWRTDHGLREPVPTTVDDLSEGLRYGTAQKSYPEPNGVAVLRIPNVASGRISLEDLKYSKLESKEFAKLRLNEGDILVVRSNGSLDLVGRAALVTGDAIGLAYAGYLIRIRPKHDVVMPKFLTLMLEAPAIRSVIEAGARSTSGVNNINATELGALTVPLFDIDEQAEIVRRITSAFCWLDRMAADHAAAARLLPKLDAAILAKAFRGELVPQDPSEEPAAKLLERIKAERQATPKVKRGRNASLPPITGTAEITSVAVTVSATGTNGKAPARTRKVTMTKSRQDDDVKGKPYLAGLLKSGRYSDAQRLFRAATLPVADFYKQLAWEVEKGYILDNAEELKVA